MYEFGGSVNWTKIETLHSASGEVPTGDDLNAEVYRAQIVQCNARRAEALVLQHPADPLLTIRSLLFRGRLNEAKNLLTQIQTQPTFDNLSLVQFLVEEARLAVFRGAWPVCVSLCDRALAQDLPGITRLTCLQLRALGHFELGQFQAARSDLARVNSLGALFPKSISVFYAEIIQMRLEAREIDFSQAQSKLKEKWAGWLSEGGDIDQLQTLLRTEVDLRRLAGQEHFDFALASYIVADTMGEGLYAAIAILDCKVSCEQRDVAFFDSWLLPLAADFERVVTLQKELMGLNEASTSVRAILDYRQKALRLGAARAFSKDQVKAKHLVVPEYGFLVTLEPFKVVDLRKYGQLLKALSLLANGPISKPAFFREIWGNQKYSPLLHDNIIYALLHRLKKNCAVTVNILEGSICLRETLAII